MLLAEAGTFLFEPRDISYDHQQECEEGCMLPLGTGMMKKKIKGKRNILSPWKIHQLQLSLSTSVFLAFSLVKSIFSFLHSDWPRKRLEFVLLLDQYEQCNNLFEPRDISYYDHKEAECLL